MAAITLTIRAFKDGTVDSETIAMSFDDSTDIPRHVTLYNRETGESAGIRLNGDSRNLDLLVDSDVEIRST